MRQTDWLLLQDHPVNTPSLSLLSFTSKYGGRAHIYFLNTSSCGNLSQRGMSSFKYSCQHLMLLQHYVLGEGQWISLQAALWCPREAVPTCPISVPPNPILSTEGHLMVTSKVNHPPFSFRSLLHFKEVTGWLHGCYPFESLNCYGIALDYESSLFTKR